MFRKKRYDPPPPPPMPEEDLRREFSPPPEPIAPPAFERSPEITTTKIDAQITGAVQLNDDFSFRISGDVEGDLSCDAVEIVESGTMRGTLEANWITIAGTFNGKIKTNQLTVAATAVARGEFLVRDSIVIEPNADFKGQLTRPSEEEAAAAPEAEPPAMANDEQADASGRAAQTGATSPVAAPVAPTPLFGGANRPLEDRDDSAPTMPRITGAAYDSGEIERPQPGAPVSPFSRPDPTS